MCMQAGHVHVVCGSSSWLQLASDLLAAPYAGAGALKHLSAWRNSNICAWQLTEPAVISQPAQGHLVWGQENDVPLSVWKSRYL